MFGFVTIDSVRSLLGILRFIVKVLSFVIELLEYLEKLNDDSRIPYQFSLGTLAGILTHWWEGTDVPGDNTPKTPVPFADDNAAKQPLGAA